MGKPIQSSPGRNAGRGPGEIPGVDYLTAVVQGEIAGIKREDFGLLVQAQAVPRRHISRTDRRGGKMITLDEAEKWLHEYEAKISYEKDSRRQNIVIVTWWDKRANGVNGSTGDTLLEAVEKAMEQEGENELV